MVNDSLALLHFASFSLMEQSVRMRRKSILFWFSLNSMCSLHFILQVPGNKTSHEYCMMFKCLDTKWNLTMRMGHRVTKELLNHCQYPVRHLDIVVTKTEKSDLCFETSFQGESVEKSPLFSGCTRLLGCLAQSVLLTKSVFYSPSMGKCEMVLEKLSLHDYYQVAICSEQASAFQFDFEEYVKYTRAFPHLLQFENGTWACTADSQYLSDRYSLSCASFLTEYCLRELISDLFLLELFIFAR